MTASIPRLHSALNFFMNAILICWGCSQYRNYSTRTKDVLPVFYVAVFCCILCTSDEHLLLDQSPYASFCVFYGVYAFPQCINVIGINQQLVFTIYF
jgi:hypothetical protein